MNVTRRAAEKSLALILSLSLVLPGFASAAGGNAISADVEIAAPVVVVPGGMGLDMGLEKGLPDGVANSGLLLNAGNNSMPSFPDTGDIRNLKPVYAPVVIGQEAAASGAITPASSVGAAVLSNNIDSGSNRNAYAAKQALNALGRAVLAGSNSNGRFDQIYDNNGAGPGVLSEDEGSGEEGESDEKLSPESEQIHKDYAEKAKKRIDDLKAEAAQIHIGRFGLSLFSQPTPQGEMFLVAVTLEGSAVRPEAVEQKFATGEIPSAERNDWDKIQEEADRFIAKFKRIGQRNEAEHRAAHQRMAVIERAAKEKKAQAKLHIGQELQQWGIPNTIAVDHPDTPEGLRYASLYRMDGNPTTLGVALHKILSPLVAADPEFLSKVTKNQLHDAVKILFQSLVYVMNEDSSEFQKMKRMGMLVEPWAYPEKQQMFIGLAKKKITQKPEPGDVSEGLGNVPEERQPAAVLKAIMQETAQEYQQKRAAGADQNELQPLQDLFVSLSAIVGQPIQVGPGMFLPVKILHRQLKPILAALKERNVHEDVIKAVIRSFPLGESIWRLGVHKLWEQGITGKGVKIAVIDNGVDFKHPDLADLPDKSKNYTRDSGWFAKGSHGTPMADIVHTLAPDAEIMSYQALSNTPFPGVRLSGEETDRALRQAMDQAKADGANVINLSLGAPMGLANDAMVKKIAELSKEGIIVVVSAGNQGFYLPENLQVGTPGTAPDAITVGAVDYHKKKAYFSSSGLSINPDNNTALEKPDIYAFGVNTKAAARLPEEIYNQEVAPYQDVSGTSPAAPHISGMAGLMVQSAKDAGIATNSQETVEAARSALRETAEYVARLPVLSDAGKAVEAFLRILRPSGTVVAS